MFRHQKTRRLSIASTIQVFLAVIFCASITLLWSPVAAAADVTAAQVNGTWKCKGGEFKIWALGQQQLQVEFSGTYEYESAAGPMANTGEGHSIASIEGDTAIFKPDGAEDECRIVMKFDHGKLIVTQTGICGFGNNVTAEGTYKRVSAKKPAFAPDDGD